MTHHPYKNLPDTRFWSSGVKFPVSDNACLAVDPISELLDVDDSIVSGGSCFAQYIGEELSTRGFNYLCSSLSAKRKESFGLGNIYTIAQLKQWLEFSLGRRVWGEHCEYQDKNQWYDLLLPHRDAMTSQAELREHRIAIKNEILAYLKKADVFIFTVGLTETWRSVEGDIYPTCPGTLVGEYDESAHFFHNSTFDQIRADLSTVESMVSDVNPNIKLVFTVSPVPLTATASDNHVLLATTYSKSVIRAAVGEHCNHSQRASYFPSYELITHPIDTDWRFERNLRSISKAGVGYVMGHAFGEKHEASDSKAHVQIPQSEDNVTNAICEEELLDGYARLADSATTMSELVLVGDSHLERLAGGFRTAGVDVIGGMVMNGSGFSDYKFELSDEQIFKPLESEQSREIWSNIHDRLTALDGHCHIITNIGFQTHVTINNMVNHYGVYVLTEKNVADYFKEYFFYQVRILRELTKLGKVWMIEDPDFHAFFSNKNTAQMLNDKNFHQYCNHMRKIAQELDIAYLNPCDAALQELFKDTAGVQDIIENDGIHGTRKYYEYCAVVLNESIGNTAQVAALAA